MNKFKTMLDDIEIIKTVKKHGTHDQSDHGNWARGGMGAGVADSILSRVRENGGLSVNMVDGSEPTSGYMVAKGAQFGSIVSADDFYDPIKGPKILADYFKKHKKELGRGKNYLGLWHNKDDGQVYLDVSENIQDRERAISAGQKQDQISIWDVTNFAEIETGGTGNVGKTRSGRDTKEHRRNDRFGNRSLRPENLGEVGKAYKVIRFAPGLIPVFKHQEHDQSTHGSWANSSERSAKEIEVQQRITQIEHQSYPVDEDGMASNRVTAIYETKDGTKIKLLHDNEITADGDISMTTKAYVFVPGGVKQIADLESSRSKNVVPEVGATIDRIEVQPEYQRQGIATAMLNFARSYSQDNIKIDHSFSLTDDAKGWSGVVKHQEHDQSSHGNWADGYTPKERARIEAMADVGPSIEDLEAILNGSGEQPDYDDLKLMVENEESFYLSAIDGIEERVAALIEENPNSDYNTVYDEEQEKMIDEFIQNSGPGELAGLWMDQNGGDTDSLLSDVKPFFEEIFNTEHTVVNAAGDDVTTLSSKIQYVEMTNDTPSGEQGILVTGDVKDSNGNYAGEFKRVFYKQDGVWVVEHKLLKLADDYKGLGFGKEFIDRSEDWYTQRGFGAILVGTGWDGARVWARDGFDWDPESASENFERMLEDRITGYNSVPSEEFQYLRPARVEFDALMERATNGYVSDEEGARFDSVKDFKNDDFPLPQDFAMIGYKRRTTSDYTHPITGDTKKATTWAGERLFQDLNLNYVKILTPEGRNLFEGPVDRDGDGLVYDGTAREKPAPQKP